MSESKNTKALVRQIVKGLTDRGILVRVQPAVTTSSVYLIFDKGVLKSARVGDHKGKPKYHYTYEIGSHIKNYQEIVGVYMGSTFTRYRFPEDQVEDFITQVLISRSNIKAKYGKDNYKKFLENA